MRRVLVVLCVAFSICLLPMAAWAQDETAEAGGNVSRVFLTAAKSGQDAQWLDGAAAHARWHRDQNDPWGWVGFYVETGRYAGMYGWVTTNHAWGDFDEYDATMREADEANYAITAGLYTESLDSWFSEQIAAISNPAPLGALSPLYRVTEYRVATGQQEAFVGALTQIVAALREGGFDRHYTWSVKLDGRGPTYSLVLPLDGWGDLAPPERPFEQVLVEQLGAEATGELMAAIGRATIATDSWIVRILEDLTHLPGQ